MAMAHAGLFITDMVTLITTIMKESPPSHHHTIPPSHFISRVCMAASFLFIIVLMKIRKSPINLGPKSKYEPNWSDTKIKMEYYYYYYH